MGRLTRRSETTSAIRFFDCGDEVETSRSRKGEEVGRREMRYSTKGLTAGFAWRLGEEKEIRMSS